MRTLVLSLGVLIGCASGDGVRARGGDNGPVAAAAARSEVATTEAPARIASSSGATDADGDGLADASDRCPNAPEDRDGFEDDDGCPDPDDDHDGVRDAVDRCPNDAELFNGFQDEDGCPDDPPRMVVPSSTQRR